MADPKKKKLKVPELETTDHLLLEMRNNTLAVKELDKIMEMVILKLDEISKKLDVVK